MANSMKVSVLTDSELIKKIVSFLTSHKKHVVANFEAILLLFVLSLMEFMLKSPIC